MSYDYDYDYTDSIKYCYPFIAALTDAFGLPVVDCEEPDYYPDPEGTAKWILCEDEFANEDDDFGYPTEMTLTVTEQYCHYYWAWSLSREEGFAPTDYEFLDLLTDVDGMSPERALTFAKKIALVAPAFRSAWWRAASQEDREGIVESAGLWVTEANRS